MLDECGLASSVLSYDTDHLSSSYPEIRVPNRFDRGSRAGEVQVPQIPDLNDGLACPFQVEPYSLLRYSRRNLSPSSIVVPSLVLRLPDNSYSIIVTCGGSIP